MASQNVNREYDVTFVNPPPPEVQTECPICHCVLFRPRMATCQCGYSYCSACIDRVERDGKPCPLCSQPFCLVNDNRLERILNGYEVYCPHKEKGCEWTGELGQLDNHLNRNPQPDKLLEGCQFQDIPCRLCQLYRCERQLMTNHISNECQNRDIDCDYSYAGCDFKKPKQQLEQHMKDSVSLHLSLVSNYMLSNLSLKEKEVCELKTELGENKDTVDNLKRVLTIQRKVIRSIVIAGILFAILLVFLNVWHIDSSVLKMKENISTQQHANKLELLKLKKQHFEALRKELKEYLSTQQRDNKLEINRLFDLRKQTDHCESTMSSQLSETKCTCPSIPESKLNTIENEIQYLRQQLDYPSLPVDMKFTELIESGDRLLSLPFYASDGYLMRLVVYPKGTGSGTNTHMSVYVHLMKGKHDSILDWPFKGVVKVTLQYKFGLFWKPPSNVFNFSDASDLAARVIDGTMSMNGLGEPCFVSHKMINLFKHNVSLYFSISYLHDLPVPISVPKLDILKSDIFFIVAVVLLACCCLLSAKFDH